jgi:hypothetical protein
MGGRQEESMRTIVAMVCALGILVSGAAGTSPKSSKASDDQSSIVIIFKDGHQQSFPVADVASIEFKTPVSASTESPVIPSRNHYVGKWEVGEGNGNNFFIILESDGTARKSLGEKRGTWTLVDGEARISWDDGWHDVIRKVGMKHEKVAFEPGKSFTDEPSNITAARNTQPKSL